jgi:hypothetical protein
MWAVAALHEVRIDPPPTLSDSGTTIRAFLSIGWNGLFSPSNIREGKSLHWKEPSRLHGRNLPAFVEIAVYQQSHQKRFALMGKVRHFLLHGSNGQQSQVHPMKRGWKLSVTSVITSIEDVPLHVMEDMIENTNKLVNEQLEEDLLLCWGSRESLDAKEMVVSMAFPRKASSECVVKSIGLWDSRAVVATANDVLIGNLQSGCDASQWLSLAGAANLIDTEAGIMIKEVAVTNDAVFLLLDDGSVYLLSPRADMYIRELGSPQGSNIPRRVFPIHERQTDTNTTANTKAETHECWYKVPLADVVAIRAGCMHVMLLAANGSVAALGTISLGRLGKRSFDDISTADWQRPANSGMVMIACGRAHNLAADGDGHLWSCGRNDFGQTGHDAGSETIYLWTRVPWELDPCYGKIVQIAAATFHSTCLTERGMCFVWGRKGVHAGDGGRCKDSHLPTLAIALSSSLYSQPWQAQCATPLWASRRATGLGAWSCGTDTCAYNALDSTQFCVAPHKLKWPEHAPLPADYDLQQVAVNESCGRQGLMLAVKKSMPDTATDISPLNRARWQWEWQSGRGQVQLCFVGTSASATASASCIYVPVGALLYYSQHFWPSCLGQAEGCWKEHALYKYNGKESGENRNRNERWRFRVVCPAEEMLATIRICESICMGSQLIRPSFGFQEVLDICHLLSRWTFPASLLEDCMLVLFERGLQRGMSVSVLSDYVRSYQSSLPWNMIQILSLSKDVVGYPVRLLTSPLTVSRRSRRSQSDPVDLEKLEEETENWCQKEMPLRRDDRHKVTANQLEVAKKIARTIPYAVASSLKSDKVRTPIALIHYSDFTEPSFPDSRSRYGACRDFVGTCHLGVCLALMRYCQYVHLCFFLTPVDDETDDKEGGVTDNTAMTMEGNKSSWGEFFRLLACPEEVQQDVHSSMFGEESAQYWRFLVWPQ